jgi:hypothetical protein
VVRIAPPHKGAAPTPSRSIARSYHRRHLSHHGNRRQQMSQRPAPSHEPGVAPANGLQDPPKDTLHHPCAHTPVASVFATAGYYHSTHLGPAGFGFFEHPSTWILELIDLQIATEFFFS